MNLTKKKSKNRNQKQDKQKTREKNISISKIINLDCLNKTFGSKNPETVGKRVFIWKNE